MQMSNIDREDVLLSRSYWKSRCNHWTEDDLRNIAAGSVFDEACFCLLGGYGITFENNHFYFKKLDSAGLLEEQNGDHDAILAILQTRFIENDTRYFYRFPAQRARRLERFINTFQMPIGYSDLEMRNFLTEFEGIGLKTASWIVRNALESRHVAIIDVHVTRACQYLGVFPEKMDVSRSYLDLEQRFLDFAASIDVNPAVLDIVMWRDMRDFGSRLLSSENSSH
jgi:N-glycosylase/DNA lyase